MSTATAAPVEASASPAAALPGRMVSWSQVSHSCGYALKFHRERAPRGPLGVALIYGSAAHEGVEYGLSHREATNEDAIAVAQRTFTDAVELAEKTGERPIRWDSPPRTTKAGLTYQGDESRVPSLEVALPMLAAQVGGFLDRYRQQIVPRAVEERIDIKLSRPEGWTITCHLDLITEADEIIDIKTAAEKWDHAKVRSRIGQAHIYHAAFRQKYGRPASGFRFLNMLKGTSEVQVVSVPYDVEEINRTLEHLVRPNIAAIEAGAFVPNTAGWWHSDRWCDFWGVCPLGAAAEAEPFPA